ncbi:unnamed protein product [Zymoseptoria tritici ST99CH_3D7]|uniref:Uncharacterized protein n=1 Tax=Zymoseptoria tritici (strain ST99CH_3D7) TaxID=1276538 RepID=A0A1X7RDW8_ZYMT9|nr:unnamed protein product [Zymoseptoria tritici ST99CH_3D7]
MASTQRSEGTAIPNGNDNGYNPLSNPSLRRPMAQTGAAPRPMSQVSYRPSYMSHVPTTSRTDSVAIEVPKSSLRPETPAKHAITPRGLLLVLVAGSIPASMMDYLEMLLGRQNFSGLIIAATQEQEVLVKKLKMDIYGLIGRMEKELGVSIHLKDGWSQAGVETTLQEITGTGESVQGILCCPDFGSAEGSDILDLDEDDLEKSWKKSMGFLHAASRASIRPLIEQCKKSRHLPKDTSGRGPHGPFFLVTGSAPQTAVSQITKSACDNLLNQLARATSSDDLIVGYTEALLIPDPVVIDGLADGNDLPLRSRNGNGIHHDADDEPFIASESPTKLWNMWSSMQHDV